MTKYIGFDATETHRMGGGGTYDTRTTCQNCGGEGTTGKVRKSPCHPCRGTGELMYDIQFPLREFGMDRPACERSIAAAGLPVPVKSACFFCGASKKHEIAALPDDLYQLSVDLESHYRTGKHWRGDDATVVGLGRNFTWESQRKS